MTTRPADLLRLHLAVAGFGFAGVFGKLLALSPVLIVAGRTGFAAAALALVVLVRRPERGPAEWRPLLVPGVMLAAHWWMFFEAVQASTVAVALVSFSAFPILVILWEAAAHRRRPALLDLAAAAAALLGVAVIAPSFHLADGAFRGLLWGLASGAAFAVIILWNRRQVAACSPLWLALAQNAIAFAVLLPFAMPARPTGREWLILACLGVVFTAGTHGLFIRSLRTVPARLASLACTLEPVYGILAAALLLREVPAPRTLLGAALVLAAVVASTLRQAGPEGDYQPDKKTER